MKSAPQQTDNLYPMRVVTRLTGLSAHTIRVWERRYSAVSPERTSGNSRRYSADDVRRLILLHDATGLGYKIKDVAELSDEDLTELVAVEPSVGAPQTAESGSMTDQVSSEYLDAIRRFDTRASQETLSRAAMVLEPTLFVFEVVLPILRETGNLWESKGFTVAHEHLVTYQMRGLLDTLQRLTSTQPGAPRILVATPAGYQHEFGALVGSLLATARGFEPVYLGASVPLADLIAAVSASRIDLVLLGVLNGSRDRHDAALDEDLAQLAEKAEVWVGLPPDHPNAGTLESVRYFDRFEDLDIALTQRV